MQANIVSATEASRTFSEILNRVYYQHQIFDIKRGKDIIAKIIPVTARPMPAMHVKELKNFFHHLPVLDDKERELFEHELEGVRQQRPEEGRHQWD